MKSEIYRRVLATCEVRCSKKDVKQLTLDVETLLFPEALPRRDYSLIPAGHSMPIAFQDGDSKEPLYRFTPDWEIHVSKGFDVPDEAALIESFQNLFKVFARTILTQKRFRKLFGKIIVESVIITPLMVRSGDPSKDSDTKNIDQNKNAKR